MTWLFTCCESKWSRRKLKKLISIRKLAEKTSCTVLQNLILIHAWGGCDSTPAVYGHGKCAIIKIIQKSESVLSCCKTLANDVASYSQIASGGSKILWKCMAESPVTWTWTISDTSSLWSMPQHQLRRYNLRDSLQQKTSLLSQPTCPPPSYDMEEFRSVPVRSVSSKISACDDWSRSSTKGVTQICTVQMPSYVKDPLQYETVLLSETRGHMCNSLQWLSKNWMP